MTDGFKRGWAFVFLLAAILLLPSFQSATAASVSSCNVTTCWAETSPPAYGTLGPYSSFAVPYANGVNANMTGIVFMVVHNSLGQTVEISTSVLQLAPNANGTAIEIVFGLASGMYSATFFVVTFSGVAVSETTTASFTFTCSECAQ